jgi:inosine-uridine nucleoside N-ribohydrolase
MWDELAAAYVADPTVATRTVEGYMDVEIERGMGYGQAHVWADDFRPHAGERKVTIVEDVDSAKLREMLVKAAGFEGKAH